MQSFLFAILKFLPFSFLAFSVLTGSQLGWQLGSLFEYRFYMRNLWLLLLATWLWILSRYFNISKGFKQNASEWKAWMGKTNELQAGMDIKTCFFPNQDHLYLEWKSEWMLGISFASFLMMMMIPLQSCVLLLEITPSIIGGVLWHKELLQAQIFILRVEVRTVKSIYISPVPLLFMNFRHIELPELLFHIG